MKTAVRNVQTAPSRSARFASGGVIAGLLLAAGTAVAAEPVAWASDTVSFTPVPLAAPSDGIALTSGSVIEISSSTLPRFDSFDGSSRTQQRLDMALLSPGRSAFGVTMGVAGLSPSRSGANAVGSEGLAGVNLGLRYRYVFDDHRRVDVTAWREMGRPNDALAMIQSREAGYGARVEMRLASSRSPLVAEGGFIGVRLDGGARITLKRSGGRPMVYYRNQF